MLPADFLAAARALIAADSVTDRGNLRAVAVLESLWQQAGFATRRLPSLDTPDRDANLLCGPIGSGNAPPLLLVTHLDTVDPGPLARWHTDPFSLTIKDDRAFGLGVADVKLDALCKLWAVKQLDPASLARPVWFLGTYGEEAGLRGARAFTQSPPFQARFVMCGEPSSLQLHDAHKGYAMVRIDLDPATPELVPPGLRTRLTFHGKAAHSSTPALGVNAIDLALAALETASYKVLSLAGGSSTNTLPASCEVVVDGHVEAPPHATAVTFEDPNPSPDLAPALPQLRVVRELWSRSAAALQPAHDARFTPAHAVANLTLARTNGPRISAWFDARLLPAHDVDAFHESFATALSALPRDSITLTRTIERAANGMSLPPGSELVRRLAPVLQAAGLDAEPKAKPTSTEGGVFVRAGAEAIVFGPSPSTGNAHTANEFAIVSEVERAIALYAAMIQALCAKL